MKLAYTQIALGVLIIGVLVWFIGWVEYDHSPFTVTWYDIEVEMQPLPGWHMRLIYWKVASFVPGLAILGCGIGQLLGQKHREIP